MTSIIQSAAVPEILWDKIYLIYIAAFFCFLFCALAIWSQHFLAAIKFGFAGAGGILLAHFVSFILASFVMSCLFSFGAGLVSAWYIIERKGSVSQLTSLIQKTESAIK